MQWIEIKLLGLRQISIHICKISLIRAKLPYCQKSFPLTLFINKKIAVMSEFATLLSRVLSPDNSTRTEAEAALASLLSTSSISVAQSLLETIGSADINISSLSAVLFRKKIVDSLLFSSFDSIAKSTILSSLVSLIVPSRPLSLLKKIGDILANIANTDNWALDFFRLVVSWGAVPELKELTLYLFEISVEFSTLLPILEQNIENVVSLLTNFMNDSSKDIVLSSVNTLASLLSGLSDESKVLKYSKLAVPMIQALKSATTEEKLRTALASIADLTETQPRFWKDVVPEFVSTITTIANAEIDPDTRSSAVEVLVTFVQRAPGMIKKNSIAIVEICQAAMNLTYRIDFQENLKEWTSDESDFDVVNNDCYSLGKDLLNKAAKFLEAANVLPFFMRVIPEFLKDNDWVKQHTALLTVGFIAEGCHDKFKENLTEIIAMILPFASSENPRLQWAFSTTVGLLCTEFEPFIQISYHSLIVPAFINILTTSNNIKVITQTVSALVNFTRGVLVENNSDSSPVTLYAQTILKTLAGLLQNTTSFKLMNETLGAISTTATAMEDQFAPYYSEFMPALKNLVTKTFTTPEQQEVRANCIRCMGHCVESISEHPNESFEDVKTIMSGLVALKNTLDSEDPAALAINEVVSQFSDCLKLEFMPFLEVFMPDLLNKANAAVDIALTDSDVELPTGMNAVTFDFKGQGSKQLAVNTTVLQHKIKACRILYDLVSSLKTGFNPYVEATLKVLTPLFNYSYNADIRKYSIKTVVAIFICQDSQTSETLLRILAPMFVQSLASPKSSPEDLKRTIKGLQSCLDYVSNKAVIGLATANEIASTLANCVKSLFERKVVRKTELKGYDDPDMYSEEIEILKEEDEIDDKILSGVMEVVGMLLKGFKKEFQTTFLNYFKNLYGEIFFRDHATDNEILAAICIFDDYVENTSDLIWNNGNSPILDQMLKYATNQNANIRQSAVFGLGVCAQAIDSAQFSPFLNKAIESIKTILADSKARTDEYTIATDCAVGALGKIALYHNNSLIEDWLNYLPIKAEIEEAQSVHSLFFANFEKLKGFPRTRVVLSELAKITQEEQVLDQNSLNALNEVISNLA